MGYVRITREDGRKLDLPLGESSKPGCNYHIPKGTDGFHLKSKSSVEKHYKKKYPKAEIEVKP